MSSEQPEKVVRITMKDGIPVPDVDPVEVKQNVQKLRWAADFDFRITMDGYADLQYSNGGEFTCKTGNFREEKRYKYTISANGVDNDPSVDIKP
jgi:flagellar basal body rod protein FlgF